MDENLFISLQYGSWDEMNPEWAEAAIPEWNRNAHASWVCWIWGC